MSDPTIVELSANKHLLSGELTQMSVAQRWMLKNLYPVAVRLVYLEIQDKDVPGHLDRIRAAVNLEPCENYNFGFEDKDNG